MVELARERLGGDATLLVADLGAPLPFADGAFDDVIVSLVLHYFEDWTAPLAELRRDMATHIAQGRREIDSLAAQLAEAGLASWDAEAPDPRLIVRGRAHLLEHEAADLDRIRSLFDDLERKRDIARFLELAEEGEGVRIFIGSENQLFSLSGSSLVVSSYMNADRKIVGAVGVIGPTRLNYGRIVPIVDYTAQLVGRVLSDRKG